MYIQDVRTKKKRITSSLLGLIHQATGYQLGEMAGRLKVEQDQVLASGFGGRTSIRPVQSYLSASPEPSSTRLWPQADLLGLSLPPSGH